MKKLQQEQKEVHHITVKGNPVPMERARTSRGHFYLPERSKIWQSEVGWTVKQKIKKPLTCKLTVNLHFYRNTNHRCDIDNLVKNVLDGMMKIVYLDDSQIYALCAWKMFDRQNPRVEIIIMGWDNGSSKKV